MTERYRLVQERQDRRAALVAWVLVNVHRDTEHRQTPFDLTDIVSWLGHGFQRTLEPIPEPEPESPTPDDLLKQVEMLNDLYGGADQRVKD